MCPQSGSAIPEGRQSPGSRLWHTGGGNSALCPWDSTAGAAAWIPKTDSDTVVGVLNEIQSRISLEGFTFPRAGCIRGKGTCLALGAEGRQPPELPAQGSVGSTAPTPITAQHRLSLRMSPPHSPPSSLGLRCLHVSIPPGNPQPEGAQGYSAILHAFVWGHCGAQHSPSRACLCPQHQHMALLAQFCGFPTTHRAQNASLCWVGTEHPLLTHTEGCDGMGLIPGKGTALLSVPMPVHHPLLGLLTP